jgi:type I restriction enzyme S subunit
MRKMRDSGIEWVGAMPRAWKMNTIAQIFLQVKCKNTRLQEKNLLSLSYGKVKRKSIDTVEGLLPESFDGYNIIEKDDIVLRLTDLQNDHTSLRVGLAEERGIITSAYLTIRNRSNFCPKYLYYYLHSFDIAKGFYGMGAGVRQGLNWDGVKWLKILAPSVPEQERIAAFLDAECAEIDAVLERTRASIEEYKKLKQAVITQAVTKGIRGDRPMKNSGIEWIGDIPAEWNKDKVIRVFSVIGSGTTPKSSDENLFDGNTPWIQSGDINGKNLFVTKNCVSNSAIESYSALRVYQAPYLVVAMYGASVGNLSLSMIDACVNQACCVLKKPTINLKFSFYIFKAVKDYLARKAVGGGQPNISQETIKQLWLPIPSADEQIEISNYLDEKCRSVDALIAKKQQYLTEIENYKKSLIYEYVTGKKEVI